MKLWGRRTEGGTQKTEEITVIRASGDQEVAIRISGYQELKRGKAPRAPDGDALGMRGRDARDTLW